MITLLTLNKETFIGYLNEKTILDRQALNELEKVVDEYPYFQSARILLTMNLAVEDPLRFDEELKATAIRVTDRRWLKKHIQEMLKIPESFRHEPGESTIEVEQRRAEGQEEKVGEEPEGASAEKDQEVAAPESVIEQLQESPALEEREKTADAPEIESLEQEVVGLQEQQVNAPTEPDEAAKPAVEVKHEPEDRLARLKQIVEARLRSIREERGKSIEAPPGEEHPTEATQPPQASIPESELIDEFIRNEPSISRSRFAFFNPVDAARDSIVDEENIVSETLAQIYFDQGKYEKAINIFRKLSLIYPEKSSYFARLIEKAKAELNK